MTSFLVGIIVLVAVTLAVARSLIAERSRGPSDPDGNYGRYPDSPAYTEPANDVRIKRRRDGDDMVDDFVLQDAVEEDEHLTGVWEE